MIIPVVFTVVGGFLLGSDAHLLRNRRSCHTKCPRKCPTQYFPVCGSNGVNYDNDCFMAYAECSRGTKGDPITKAYDGKCVVGCDDTSCIEKYKPICGSDNVTYSNECFLNVANCQRLKDPPPTLITQVYKGECSANCNIPCPKIYDPVCGSDGKTHSNDCVLSVANCKRDQSESLITIVYKRKCGWKDCLDFCDTRYDPVCGSDGKIYSNACLLNMANCKRDRNEPRITIVYKGESKSTNCLDECRPITQGGPVCGSDCKTYRKPCSLTVANGKRERNEPRITVAYEGECGPNNCPDACITLYDPVCGSDGKTYSNTCFLNMANCKKGQNEPCITIVYTGMCWLTI